MGGEKIEYVDFGGVLVPSDSNRVTIPDENNRGRKLYCVFLDNDGTKVTYPEQTTGSSPGVKYAEVGSSYSMLSHEFKSYERPMSKNLFDIYWNKVRTDEKSFSNNDVTFYYYTHGLDGKQYRQIDMNNRAIGSSTYMEYPVSPIPKVEYETDGLIFDTKKIKLSNLKDAVIRGSDDEDEITMENCTNCTADVHDYNNNVLFSDKVKIVNGSGNKVVSGDHDKTTFASYNYTTAKETVKKECKGEGTFEQP